MSSVLKHTPLLSVTVLNYNYGHFLPTCLDSILGQTFPDFEVILINDKSTDNSVDIIQPYLSDPRVRLVDHVENKGFVRSLIEGVELSRGKYITVISADDWSLDKTAFEKQIAILESEPEIAFVFTSYGVCVEEGECILIVHPFIDSIIQPGIAAFSDLLLGVALHHSGTFIQKSSYDQMGGYNPKLRYAVDLQMWLGLCHVGKVAFIREPLYAYRSHDKNMSKARETVSHSIKEVLSIIDWSFSFLPPTERRAYDKLYKKAVRKALSSYAMLYTFNHDQPGLGWTYFWVAVKLHPYETLVQKTTLLLLLRTILGKQGYQFLERAKGLVSKKTHDRLTAGA
jgi:glycosyltransferase involved in cell wall biosynthesis